MPRVKAPRSHEELLLPWIVAADRLCLRSPAWAIQALSVPDTDRPTSERNRLQ